MKAIKYLLLSFIITSCALYSEEVPHRETILNDAQELPHWGTLTQLKSDGFVFVNVSNDYIEKLLQILEADGFMSPIQFDGPDPIGAHISVIYGSEAARIGNILEEGQVISFTIKDCILVQPNGWNEIEQVYCIVVDAPELDQLRESYGLPKKLYDFHITIGVKPLKQPIISGSLTDDPSPH